MRSLYIYGAGNLGREVVELVEDGTQGAEQYTVKGFIDDSYPSGTLISGIETMNLTELSSEFSELGNCALAIALGNPAERERAYGKLASVNLVNKLVSLVSRRATLSNQAFVGSGTLIFPHATIGTKAMVGDNVLIYFDSLISHDVDILSHCSILSKVVVGGGSKIAESSFVGMGALVRERLSIGKNCVIGMGSVVTQSVGEGTVVFGNPARRVESYQGKGIFKS